MNLKSNMVQRHSIRKFSDKEVDIKILKDIIKQAQLAPSWKNTQPWKVYVAAGDTAKLIREKHYEYASNNTKGWAEIVPPKDESWAAYPKSNMDKWLKETTELVGEDGFKEFWELNKKLFNSSAIIYITVPKNATEYSIYDAGAFGYGILLSALEHGLGSIPAYELIRYPKIIREHFDISKDESILMGIALGYPEVDNLNKIKLSRGNLDLVAKFKN